MKKGDAVQINWVDACGTGGWSKTEDLGPSNVRTIGIYIKENKDGIYYASGVEGDDYEVPLRPGFIPKGCITKVRKLH